MSASDTLTTKVPRTANAKKCQIARFNVDSQIAVANNMKQSAASGANRPKCDVPTASGESMKSNWPVPKSIFKRYSARLSKPAKPTSDAQTRDSHFEIGDAAPVPAIHAKPISIKHNAALGFIETHSGLGLFKKATSNCQPSNTNPPTSSGNMPTSVNIHLSGLRLWVCKSNKSDICINPCRPVIIS